MRIRFRGPCGKTMCPILRQAFPRCGQALYIKNSLNTFISLSCVRCAVALKLLRIATV